MIARGVDVDLAYVGESLASAATVGVILGPVEPICGYPSMAKVELGQCETLSESEIVRRHDRLVGALARRFSPEDFEDLIQVGRVALVESGRAWGKESQFWTYARRAVFGAMSDYVVREGREPASDLDSASALDTLEAPSRADAAHEVTELFDSLSTLETAIVTLALRDGLEVREIAHRLGKSKSDVHRILQVAVATLRERAA